MRKLTFLLACLFLIGVGLVNAQSKSLSGKVLSAEDRNIVKTEENCYYSSDGTLYMREFREYYDTGDMDKEEEE